MNRLNTRFLVRVGRFNLLKPHEYCVNVHIRIGSVYVNWDFYPKDNSKGDANMLKDELLDLWSEQGDWFDNIESLIEKYKDMYWTKPRDADVILEQAKKFAGLLAYQQNQDERTGLIQEIEQKRDRLLFVSKCLAKGLPEYLNDYEVETGVKQGDPQ